MIAFSGLSLYLRKRNIFSHVRCERSSHGGGINRHLRTTIRIHDVPEPCLPLHNQLPLLWHLQSNKNTRYSRQKTLWRPLRYSRHLRLHVKDSILWRNISLPSPTAGIQQAPACRYWLFQRQKQTLKNYTSSYSRIYSGRGPQKRSHGSMRTDYYVSPATVQGEIENGFTHSGRCWSSPQEFIILNGVECHQILEANVRCPHFLKR